MTQTQSLRCNLGHWTQDVSRRLIFVLLLLLAALLRLSLLSGQRFQPDEALYTTWARLIATGQDVWLAERVVDKPPLFFYCLALLFGTLGASEEIARLPSLLASLCSIGLIYCIACELYRDRRVALFTAFALALSPLAILFAPTAFVDPLLLCLLLLSAWLGLRRRVGLSGFAFGLSLATKQDALLFAPLLMLVQILEFTFQIDKVNLKSKIKNLKLFLFGVAMPLALMVLWSIMRPQPNFLQTSLDHYGGLTFVSPDAYAERVLSLLRLSETLSSAWLLIPALALSPLIIARERSRYDLLLLATISYWLATHLVVSFPIWDRYLLPLAPLVALLVGRNSIYVLDQLRSHAVRGAGLLLMLVLLAQPARAALQAEMRVGRDFGAHAGLDQVGEYFWHIDTTATVVYVHDLSWEVDYYTFGQPLDRRWAPTPEQLASDAAHMSWAQRFVVLAEWEPMRADLPRALAKVNLKAEPVLLTQHHDGSASVSVYKITPQAVSNGGDTQSERLTTFTFY